PKPFHSLGGLLSPAFAGQPIDTLPGESKLQCSQQPAEKMRTLPGQRSPKLPSAP
ncbi:Star-Related Lipid Transfer Protein 9, partial [Manis pentadactyla]